MESISFKDYAPPPFEEVHCDVADINRPYGLANLRPTAAREACDEDPDCTGYACQEFNGDFNPDPMCILMSGQYFKFTKRVAKLEADRYWCNDQDGPYKMMHDRDEKVECAYGQKRCYCQYFSHESYNQKLVTEWPWRYDYQTRCALNGALGGWGTFKDKLRECFLRNYECRAVVCDGNNCQMRSGNHCEPYEAITWFLTTWVMEDLIGGHPDERWLFST
eukprot:TRINITY_DN11913_c0_g2_i1.p1 TRINITY_DN11913_c0_g2~~TRINITY_DN11913_c0_g2_i1.p1  ORF type:complete len:220 (-),score=18.09 TRINITY_DN11913_c0_g2_i1:65-724(-)